MAMRRRAFVGAFALALTASVTARAAEERTPEPTTPPAPTAPAPPSPPPPPPPAPAADERTIVVWPTLTPAGDGASVTELHRPTAKEGAVYTRAQDLDATLRDAVQDLGFTLDLADNGPDVGHARDLDMVERAQKSGMRGSMSEGSWVVSARLEPAGGDNFILRIVCVAANSRQIRVRVEQVKGPDVSVRGLLLLRDVLANTQALGVDAKPASNTPDAPPPSPLRSQGRATLAVNAALFGAYAAFSIQRASGSEDPRLLYPLLALGTGVGIGSALLVAEEWDVGTGDAWYLSAGAWWGAASGILIANGRNVQPLTDRYSWGVGGGLVGLTLATFSLTRGKKDEGAAVLTHSGAGLGLVLGGLGELYSEGKLEHTPYGGPGWGAAIGLVGAGTLASLVKVSPSRVLLIDLGAGLGGLAGAAVGSPLVFEDVTAGKTRGFIGATVAGTVLGGAAAWYLTRHSFEPKKTATGLHMVPYGGAMPSPTPGGPSGFGGGVQGTF